MSPIGVYPRRVLTPDERRALFMEKVAKNADGCWLWLASVNRKGYGQFGTRERCVLAHRFSFESFVSHIPDGMCVLHSCDNPRCVNPEHLFLGTKSDNNADMRAKGRHARGEATGTARLTVEVVNAIRAASGPQSAIARKFGTVQSTVSRIKAGRIWREEHAQ